MSHCFLRHSVRVVRVGRRGCERHVHDHLLVEPAGAYATVAAALLCDPPAQTPTSGKALCRHQLWCDALATNFAPLLILWSPVDTRSVCCGSARFRQARKPLLQAFGRVAKSARRSARRPSRRYAKRTIEHCVVTFLGTIVSCLHASWKTAFFTPFLCPWLPSRLSSRCFLSYLLAWQCALPLQSPVATRKPLTR